MFKSKILNQLSCLITKQYQEQKLMFKPFSSIIEEKNASPVPDKLYKQVEVEVRGNEPAVLKSYQTFVLTAAYHLNINVTKITVPFKPSHKRWTVYKSKHIHKKHKVQYEMRTYYRTFELSHLTGSTSDTFFEYIQRNLPEGVAMKVTKTEIQQLPKSITSQAI